MRAVVRKVGGAVNGYRTLNQAVETVLLGEIVEIDWGNCREIVSKMQGDGRVILGFRGGVEAEFAVGEMVKTVRIWL